MGQVANIVEMKKRLDYSSRFCCFFVAVCREDNVLDGA